MKAIEHWLILASIALGLGVLSRQLLRKTSIPYTPVLLIAGLALGLAVRTGWAEAIFPHVFIESVRQADITELNPQALLLVFLPPLLFESGFAMDSHIFRRSLTQVVILAVPVLLLATLLGGALMKCILPGEWSWIAVLMFGALISATDPVAVVALLRELGVSKRLATVIEGESLLNDGTSIAVFMLFYGLLLGTAGDASPVLYGIKSFTLIAGGGILSGAIVAWILLAVLRRIPTDALTEITLTVISSYAAFMLAEHFKVSGVLAVVALGIMLSFGGRTAISAGVMEFLKHFWELCAYVANTLVFVLVGIVVAFTPAPADWLLWLGVLAMLYAGLQLVRGTAILCHLPLLHRSGYGLSLKESAILTWGGLRGAVALAMALMVAANEALPQHIRHGVLQFTAGVVVLTLLINGTTMQRLLDYLGFFENHPFKEQTRQRAVHILEEKTAAEKRLLASDDRHALSDWSRIKAWTPNVEPALSRLDPGPQSHLLEIKSLLLNNEKAHLWELYSNGEISGPAYLRILERVDLILDDLAHGGNNPPPWQPWHVPAWLRHILASPVGASWGRKLFLRRIALSYDTAKGAMLIHQRQLQTLSAMSCSEEDRRLAHDWLKFLLHRAEKTLNKIREAHPEAVRAVETAACRRLLLNSQLESTEFLQTHGLLDEAEAAEWRLKIETRLHQARLIDIGPAPSASDILTTAQWMQELPDACRKIIHDSFIERSYQPNKIICERHTKGLGILIVMRGAISADEQTLGPGALLGELQALTGTAWHFQARALTEVTCMEIPAETLQQVFEAHPELHWQLLESAALKIAETLLPAQAPWQHLARRELRQLIRRDPVIEYCSPGQELGPVILLVGSSSDGTITPPAFIDGKTTPIAPGSFVLRCPRPD